MVLLRRTELQDWSGYVTPAELSTLLDSHSLRQIARQFGVNRRTVSRWARLHGLSHKIKPTESKAIPKEQLEELLKTNSLTQIARALNVTRRTLAKWCAKYGLEILPAAQSSGHWRGRRAGTIDADGNLITEIVSCACGCGQRIHQRIRDTHGNIRQRRYVKGGRYITGRVHRERVDVRVEQAREIVSHITELFAEEHIGEAWLALHDAEKDKRLDPNEVAVNAVQKVRREQNPSKLVHYSAYNEMTTPYLAAEDPALMALFDS